MLVVIGGGLFQSFAIKKAEEISIKTVCVDIDNNAPGKNLCSHFIKKSTRDYAGIIEELEKEKIKPSGVITVGTDMSRTVYEVSKHFGLDPGFNNPDVVVNKIEMRKRLKKFNIPQPDFVYGKSFEELKNKIIQSNLKFPLVIKPSENMGARGVVKISDFEDLKNNFEISSGFSPDKRVIVEEYMEGPELSIETIVYNGKLFPLVTGDRHIEKEPYFVEIGHSCPSKQSEEILKQAFKVMSEAAAALGIYNGPAKGDIKISGGKIKIGEIAARLSGGFMSSHTLPLSTGIDGIKLAVKQRMGLKISEEEFEPVKNMVCLERAIYFENEFVIKKIENVDKCLKIPGVEFIHFNLKEGDKFKILKNNIGKIGNFIVRAESFKKAEKVVEKVFNTLIIK
ncbi:MAG: ATP-grasp domain-containing protein [Candidatus Muiribacteriota bacterium]|jgi:biotin carboxylase